VWPIIQNRVGPESSKTKTAPYQPQRHKGTIGKKMGGPGFHPASLRLQSSGKLDVNVPTQSDWQGGISPVFEPAKKRGGRGTRHRSRRRSWRGEINSQKRGGGKWPKTMLGGVNACDSNQKDKRGKGSSGLNFHRSRKPGSTIHLGKGGNKSVSILRPPLTGR